MKKDAQPKNRRFNLAGAIIVMVGAIAFPHLSGARENTSNIEQPAQAAPADDAEKTPAAPLDDKKPADKKKGPRPPSKLDQFLKDANSKPSRYKAF